MSEKKQATDQAPQRAGNVPERMRAVVCHAPNDLRLEEVPVPEIGPGETLIRVHAVGVCGTDFELIHGSSMLPYVGYPTIPGHEITGHVAQISSTEEGFQVGDPVLVEQHLRCGHCYYCKIGLYFFCPEYRELGLNVNGAYAQYLKAPIKNLIHAPAGIPLEHCLMAEPAAVVVRGLRRVGTRFGDTVVVVGAGPFGFAAMQVAQAMGAARLIAVGRNRERLARCAALGATSVSTLDPDWLDHLETASGGEPLDVIVDCAGSMPVIASLARRLGPEGRIVALALTGGQQIQLPADILMLREWTVAGAVSAMGHFEEGLSLLAAGRLDPRSFITHEVTLDEYARGLEYVERRTDGAIKVIMRP